MQEQDKSVSFPIIDHDGNVVDESSLPAEDRAVLENFDRLRATESAN